MRRSPPNKMLQWVGANPVVKEWFDRIARGSKKSARVYAYYLYPYWRDYVAKRLPSVEAWIAEVKKQHKSDEVIRIPRHMERGREFREAISFSIWRIQ